MVLLSKWMVGKAGTSKTASDLLKAHPATVEEKESRSKGGQSMDNDHGWWAHQFLKSGCLIGHFKKLRSPSLVVLYLTFSE